MRSFLERLFGKGTSARGARPANDAEDILGDVREQVRRDVRAGFDDPAAILQSAIEVFGDEADPAVLEDHARRCLGEELAAHVAEQQAWPAPTDCDRLDAAFDALEKDGIISRQHFSCCGTCGSAEIWDEVAVVEKRGDPARGYAFYHVQDTEAAVDGYGIYLNYGASEEGEEAAVTIGREIVAGLERHGLTTEWDGSLGKRIGVKLDWKRRRAA